MTGRDLILAIEDSETEHNDIYIDIGEHTSILRISKKVHIERSAVNPDRIVISI